MTAIASSDKPVPMLSLIALSVGVLSLMSSDGLSGGMYMLVATIPAASMSAVAILTCCALFVESPMTAHLPAP